MDFFRKIEKGDKLEGHSQNWSPENTIEIERKNFLSVVENICKQSRYPLLTLRIFIHIICGIDGDGQAHFSTRQMAKTLDAHYDTASKCIRFLKEIDVLRVEK